MFHFHFGRKHVHFSSQIASRNLIRCPFVCCTHISLRQEAGLPYSPFSTGCSLFRKNERLLLSQWRWIFQTVTGILLSSLFKNCADTNTKVTLKRKVINKKTIRSLLYKRKGNSCLNYLILGNLFTCLSVVFSSLFSQGYLLSPLSRRFKSVFWFFGNTHTHAFQRSVPYFGQSCFRSSLSISTNLNTVRKHLHLGVLFSSMPLRLPHVEEAIHFECLA